MADRDDMTQPSLCANCDTPLQGDYCHRCGQDNKNYVRSAFGLITEFLGEFTNWDNRLWRTLWPLWVRPGFLSLRYVQGHRAPYVPPLRLYIFTSIVAFLVFAQAIPVDSINLNPPEETTERASGEGSESRSGLVAPPIPGRDVHFELPLVSDEINRRLEYNFGRIAENPQIGINQFFSLAPQVMFLLLPLFALVLKLIYWRRHHYYMEHLILALHTHSFGLQLAVVVVGLAMLEDAIAAWPVVPEALSVLSSLLFWSVPLYLLLSHKTFYRQGWWKSVLKFLLTATAYSFLLFTAFLFTTIQSILRS
ncbi:DUF3667 domain-containing protein [Marinimicrobium sp. UBA4209]|jgi:hypothetical protein|uniref:DUF3667 domain-containing protein n=2 Tax=Cellvibrionaceae TaxID=1706371 RepID=UPI00257A2D23|nr:DUF3667 domain-containing protein [Marinimicrobium sp. UBA4209]